MDEEWNERTVLVHYLGEIRYQLHLIWLSLLHNPDPRLRDKIPEDFFIKFYVGAAGRPRRIAQDARTDPNVQLQKQSVFALLGLQADGSKSPNAPPAKTQPRKPRQ